MIQTSYNIRMASIEKDGEEILKIYEPYILNTTVTFEYYKISFVDFQKRMSQIMEKFPWLVCEVDQKVVGYAYASEFHERAAFSWDCETSIYLDSSWKGKGAGDALYRPLIELLAMQGYYNLYALIALPNPESIKFHERHGFLREGIHKKTGYKHGKWIDLSLYAKRIQEEEKEPKQVKSIHEIPWKSVLKPI